MRGFASVACAWCVILAQPVLACDVPVFRYALERWQPDAYEVVVLHGTALSADDAALWQTITQAASVPDSLNLRIRGADSGRVPDPGLETRWRSETNAATPWLALYYPASASRQSHLWAGPITESNCEAILDSPARRAIAQALLDGESAVFVLVESGDETADQVAAETLERELAAAESTLELPGRVDDEVPDIDEQKVRIAFSMERVSRKDPSEQIFVEMLLGSEPGLRTIDAPMVFPIYGRGRSLYALAGKGINPKTIRQACTLVAGPCSCDIKDENPGIDLLFAVNWDARIDEFLLGNPEPAVVPGPALLQASEPKTIEGNSESDATIGTASVGIAQAGAIDSQEEVSRGRAISPLVSVALAITVAIVAVLAGSVVLAFRKGGSEA